MTAPLQISVSDRMRAEPASFGSITVPSYGDERAFVQSVVDDINAAWTAHGVAGAEIVEADFADDCVTVSTRAGTAPLTVAAVGHFIRAARARRKAAA